MQTKPHKLPVAADIQQTIDDLAPWFHNLHLPGGEQTAPQHPLGDFPTEKWRLFSGRLPQDLQGWEVLDIGCNAGFYSFELARRGARVTAIDVNAHYLRQARWAAKQLGLSDRVDFQQMHIYDLARWPRRFDLVLFMGIFYHLRYPLLALDIVARRVRRLVVFQTLSMPGDEVYEPQTDRTLNDRDDFLRPGWPKMAFIEHRLAGDPTNWWAVNHAAVLAMMRSSGLHLVEKPAHEIYFFEPRGATGWPADYISDELKTIFGS